MSNTRLVSFSQVAGLTSPEVTSHYMLMVNVIDFVNPDGSPYVPPTPPTPTPEPLECVTKSTTYGSTVLGSQLTGTLAVYTGGVEPVDELYQWQRSSDGSSWSGISAWATDTATTYTTALADNDQYIRFASKAVDADGKTIYGSGNNVGPIEPTPIIVTDPTIMTDGLYSNPQEVYGYQTISMHSAVFAGGYGTITTKYRLQEQTDGSAWTSLTGWQSGIPTYDVSQSEPGDKLRFQTQGKDSLGTQKTSNSSTSTVGVATEIGTVSIAPPNTTGGPGTTITYDVLISGDANPMYIWSIRSGPGAIISPTNIGQEIEVRVNADATPGDSIQVQVTCSDPSAFDNGVGSIATIVVN